MHTNSQAVPTDQRDPPKPRRSKLRLRGAPSASTVVTLCPAVGAVHAADTAYPIRPVRWVVATAPGGGVDATARILAPRLSEQMGQTWIVDNRAGAAGNVGVEIVARSNPDGYTLLAATSTVL